MEFYKERRNNEKVEKIDNNNKEIAEGSRTRKIKKC